MTPPQQPNPDEELRGGVALAIFLIFSVTRSVQLFSRVPGTTGPWFFGITFWIGLAIQLYYYQANVEASGRFDAIPEQLLIATQFGWLVVHWMVRAKNRFQGVRLHSYEPGLGVMNRLLPNWHLDWMGVTSDIAVAAVLGGTCMLLDCPILGSWYFAMIPWLLIGQAFIYGRDSLRVQRMEDAQIEADVWSQRFRERQNWMDIQRERWGNRHQ